MAGEPAAACPLCGQLRDEECGSQKFGSADNDVMLPAAVSALLVVRDLRPNATRQQQIRRCPECGTYYLYETDYEYLVNGSEDEQRLRRLTMAQAATLLARP
ncbi:MAG TPA: hypothetical protein PKM88_07505 [bacterium]|nr:hypothetical protein [bacterium]